MPTRLFSPEETRERSSKLKILAAKIRDKLPAGHELRPVAEEIIRGLELLEAGGEPATSAGPRGTA